MDNVSWSYFTWFFCLGGGVIVEGPGLCHQSLQPLHFWKCELWIQSEHLVVCALYTKIRYPAKIVFCAQVLYFIFRHGKAKKLLVRKSAFWALINGENYFYATLKEQVGKNLSILFVLKNENLLLKVGSRNKEQLTFLTDHQISLLSSQLLW